MNKDKVIPDPIQDRNPKQSRYEGNQAQADVIGLLFSSSDVCQNTATPMPQVLLATGDSKQLLYCRR
jgi:hypothetical protein